MVLLYFQRNQVSKQTLQVVNHCNNNKAIYVCSVFLSFLRTGNFPILPLSNLVAISLEYIVLLFFTCHDCMCGTKCHNNYNKSELERK